MSDWEELERAARNMQARYDKERRSLYHPERRQREREIKAVREMADRERDAHVRWLYGYGR